MRLLALLLALLPLQAAAQPVAPAHVFTGSLRTRAPEKFGTLEGCYHVVCYATQRAPCGVAAARETLAAGGGDRLDPGTAWDLCGISGVWAAPPLYGGMPIVSIELRPQPTTITVDPAGQQSAFASFKGMPARVLAPGVWHTIASNIIGMVEYELRVDGGPVYIDSHPDLSKPPDSAFDTGGGWQLRPGDPPHTIHGNQNLYAYAYPSNPGVVVTLHMVKITRGADFVVRPK